MIFSWRKLGLSLGVILLCMSFGVFAHGQAADNVTSYDSSVNEGDFEFEITPENPGPHEPVTIKVSSNLVDANRYPITWTVDGAVIASGIGKRTITVDTKDYGQSVTVSMSIQLVESTVTKQVILAPQDATILWEAVDSYAPPFYQGKKLPSYESVVRIISIPNFLSDKTPSGTKNAVYVWSRNGNAVPDAGGYGKDSILIQHNRVRENEVIGVNASSTDGSSQSSSSITISFFDPFILLYQRDPITGIRNSLSKNTFSLLGDSTIIEAEPYFFSVLKNNPNSLRLAWTMNDKPISLADARNKTILTLKNPGGDGAAILGVSAENVSKLFQSTQTAIKVLFSKK